MRSLIPFYCLQSYQPISHKAYRSSSRRQTPAPQTPAVMVALAAKQLARPSNASAYSGIPGSSVS